MWFKRARCVIKTIECCNLVQSCSINQRAPTHFTALLLDTHVRFFTLHHTHTLFAKVKAKQASHFCIFDTCNAKVHKKISQRYTSRLQAYGCMKTLRLMKVRFCVFGCKEITFSACAISKGARLFFSTKSLFQSFSLCKSCVRKQYFKTPALQMRCRLTVVSLRAVEQKQEYC